MSNKICLVCSHGGHLTELLELMHAFDNYDVFFLTYDCPRTRSLPKANLVPTTGLNPIKMLLVLVKVFFLLLRERPKLIVSTGAEIAIPAFYFGKMMGCRTIFLETWACVVKPTRTGRLVYPVSDVFLVQWPDLLKVYGKKARYEGALV